LVGLYIGQQTTSKSTNKANNGTGEQLILAVLGARLLLRSALLHVNDAIAGFAVDDGFDQARQHAQGVAFSSR